MELTTLHCETLLFCEPLLVDAMASKQAKQPQEGEKYFLAQM
jgi:hypothetical protein